MKKKVRFAMNLFLVVGLLSGCRYLPLSGFECIETDDDEEEVKPVIRQSIPGQPNIKAEEEVSVISPGHSSRLVFTKNGFNTIINLIVERV